MQPGVYQMTFRGLTFREAWRFGKEPLKFTIALVLKLIDFKGPKQWLPAHECETLCEEANLSESARQHLLPVVEQARTLGYTAGQFTIMSRNLDPSTKEGFAYLALHHDKVRWMFIGYIASDRSGTTRRTVPITGGLSTSAYDEIEFVNHPNFLDAGPWSRKIGVTGQTVADLDAAMQKFIATSRDVPRQFSSVAEVRSHAAAMGVKNFDARIARGLFRYVGVEAPPMLPLRQNS